MSTDEADVLRSLVEDLKADAAEVDPATPMEVGMVEGLGRAAGMAQARARAVEPVDREIVLSAIRRVSEALKEDYPGEFVNPDDLRVLVDYASACAEGLGQVEGRAQTRVEQIESDKYG